MKNAILVLGYNNTRINDVKKIREKAKECLGCVTVLCKVSPTEEDKKTVDYVIDVGLEASSKNVDVVLDEAKKLNINITALLPFSDPGTQLGAALAEKLSLTGANAAQVVAALDKFMFRENEKQTKYFPEKYKKIQSQHITSFEQLEKLYRDLKGNIFLKPAKEGNSRGCIDLTRESNLHKVWSEVEKYVDAGVVAEELIVNGIEFSWDHVAGYSWVTEKETTTNQYRAEVQQIVPAYLPDAVEDSIKKAGKFMGEISGYSSCACHNEIFYLPASNQVCGVEPNLRPAGMRIWDLASLAFEDFDPWKEWILWAAGKNQSSSKLLKRNYYVGIRMIQAHKTEQLKLLPTIDIESYADGDVELVECKWTKKPGDNISALVKDNSDFIGYIIAKSKDYHKLSKFLKEFSLNIAQEVEVG